MFMFEVFSVIAPVFSHGFEVQCFARLDFIDEMLSIAIRPLLLFKYFQNHRKAFLMKEKAETLDDSNYYNVEDRFWMKEGVTV